MPRKLLESKATEQIEIMAENAPPIPEPVPQPQPQPSDPPPAARVVLTGQRTERELTLETELETEKSSHAKTAKEKKDRETRIAELEDELHRLRHPANPAPQRSSMEEFWDL